MEKVKVIHKAKCKGGKKVVRKVKGKIKVKPKAKKRYTRIIGSTYKGLLIGKKRVSLKAEKR